MNLFSSPSPSSSSSSASSTAAATTLNRRSPRHPPRNVLIPIKSLQSPPSHLTSPPYTSANDRSSPVLPKSDEIASRRENLEQLLVRRPVIQSDGGDNEDDEIDGSDGSSDEEGDEEEEGRGEKSIIDESLEEFAKKLPIFEPGRGDQIGQVKDPPLKVNLDLALYKAKILTRNFQFDEAEKILQQG